ncbi:MAG TPA: hypothetical protein DCR20_11510 [Planctomycetaceae bacterium]|nr:hypothetical protein [Planctomycetaceae bacterium]
MYRQRHKRCSFRAAKGFSLLELLLALAVLIAVSAVAVPPLMDRLQAGRVQDAAEAVRDVLGNARRYAIDGGVDYHFRYELNGPAFVAIPAEPEPTLANSYSGDESDMRVLLEAGELDENLYLRPANDGDAGGESLEALAFNDLPNAGELAGKTWSKPILFRFDGTAEDRVFRVVDDVGRTAEITVRGLTGAIRVSQVFELEDK